MYHSTCPIEYMPFKADKNDYFLGLKRTRVSVIEASHLVCGVLPLMDNSFAFLSPYTQAIKPLYEFLKDAAENNKVHDVVFENNQIKAPLMEWVRRLVHIDSNFPFPEQLCVLINIEMERIENANTVTFDSYDSFSEMEKNQKKLKWKEFKDKICQLAEKYNQIPHIYLKNHPKIKSLIGDYYMSDSRFVDFVSKTICEAKKHRKFKTRSRGRGKSNFLDLYDSSSDDEKQWFDIIRDNESKKAKKKRN